MNKIFQNNAYRILELFIRYPTKDFSARGIARMIGLNHATVLKHIKSLLKLKVIRKKEETLYPTYYANTESPEYRLYKKNYLVFEILESNLIDYIQEQTLSFSIVLFGSGAKGEFTEKSDLDIFVESKKADLELNKYEKKLGKKINLLFEQNINHLSKELRNNIINGVVLYGFLRIS